MNYIRRTICKLLHLFYEKQSVFKKHKGIVLMLHGVEKNSANGNLYQITLEECKKLLIFLKRKNTIRLENWKQENDFYALTIDDVPSNFYYNAFPLLREGGIPFTIFVNVSLLDSEGYITSCQLKEMADCDLCTVGSHGITHSLYYKMSKTNAQKDLAESKRILEGIIGKKVEMYAFPYGSYYACGFVNKVLVTQIYKYGFSTIAAYITEPQSLPDYFIPRINVDSNFIKKTNEI